MSMNLIVKTDVTIQAPIGKVWEALTTPELIKKYFFGTDAISDWKEGSSLIFKGEWEGKTYQDKGTISKITPPTYLRYNYWSSMSGKPNTPENYANITYELSSLDDNTTNLIVTQDNVANEEAKQHSEQNWDSVLEDLKELLETEVALK